MYVFSFQITLKITKKTFKKTPKITKKSPKITPKTLPGRPWDQLGAHHGPKSS